ncbi:MAG TPA: 50S ribosomal protein L1 [Candidatus Saccharimonadales bacterium]|nr:50S ribosomal protein L1 [Candidatus Saccharimonadales bacterium]
MEDNKQKNEDAEKSSKPSPKKAPISRKVTEVEGEKAKATAKAGKRSSKSVKEAEEKVAKEERKRVDSETPEKPKVQQKPPRTRLERASKKYREVAKHIEKDKQYNLAEAVDIATKSSITKFDATVELHINLAVDPKQADQNIRGTVPLPHGTGKVSRIAVFAEGDDVTKAKSSGADIAGNDELLADLDKGQVNFDILISTSAMMPRLGKYAKLLGPKGLMPNPKSGTVTNDVARAVKESKAGRLEFRVDQAGIIHAGIGKVSFGPQKLLENTQAFISAIRSAKPASIKGAYIKSAYITTTMGPSIRTSLD